MNAKDGFNNSKMLIKLSALFAIIAAKHVMDQALVIVSVVIQPIEFYQKNQMEKNIVNAEKDIMMQMTIVLNAKNAIILANIA